MGRRLPATEWLKRLDDAHASALTGDAEGVHQVRVVIRRLRVWLELGGHDRLADELRWVCRELGPLRDLDILDETFTDDARATLRPPAVKRAREALESDQWRTLRTALDEAKSPRRRAAKRVLRRLERELKHQHVKLEPASLHEWRRSLRKVRYAREWLGKDDEVFVRAQAWLGPLCDLLALERFARAG